MKNNYKERQRQIEKSIRNDYHQNGDYFYNMEKSIDRFNKKKFKSKLVMVNGKLKKITGRYENDIPFNWDDVI